MRSKAFIPFCLVLMFIIAFPAAVRAETYQLTWDPVTTYSDATPIEATKTVSYTVYWTTDVSLALANLHSIATSISATSTSFDPTVATMPRGQIIYFTAITILSTGEQSALSAGFQWNVPSKQPGSPANMRIIKIN